MISLWGAFGLCSRFKVIMLGRSQTIFSPPYVQFEKIFDFLVVLMMNTGDDLLCLPSGHHGKQWRLSWKSHGIYYQISVAP